MLEVLQVFPLNLPDNNEPLTAEIVGGKAHGIMKMLKMGLRVPKGYVHSTHWTKHDVPEGYVEHVNKSWIRWLADDVELSWGVGDDPLLVSVRSGAPISMPGMMETVLNVGLTRDNLDDFVKHHNNNVGFGYDCYRRLLQMYGTTVVGIEPSVFENIYDAARTFWLESNEDTSKKLVELYEEAYLLETGVEFPNDPDVQLAESVKAVIRSWDSPAARQYREIENIPDDLGTAVTVQQMVFGNSGPNSGTGVVFTHNPNTGERGMYGDFLLNAQGEDVVAGTHKPVNAITLIDDENLGGVGKELLSVLGKLYHQYKDMLDVEFTIDNRELYILQYRKAKCLRRARIRLALDMTRDGVLATDEATDAILSLIPKTATHNQDLSQLTFLCKGTPATEGEAVGKVAIGHEMAEEFYNNKIPYIYVAEFTQPSDNLVMQRSAGILTATGGTMSHAVVVARGWEKVCVVGCTNLKIEADKIICDDREIHVGDLIKISSDTGEVFA